MELKIEHLHLQFFGHQECLHDLNLHFGEGLSVLYGESGCGKTALLKCIAGINEYEGSITLDGASLAYGKSGDVCMVFDDLALFGRRSLYYNLTYPLRLRKVPKAQWKETLAPILRQWGLEKTFLDNPTYRTSHLIQVQVALARASLLPRKILLLDNPLAGLTPDERRQTFRLLSQYARSYRGVVIYATDDADEVRALMAPTAVFSMGYPLAMDTPDVLRESMPCVYVASQLIPYWKGIEGVVEGGKVRTAVGEWAADYPASYEGKNVLTGYGPDDWTAEESDEGAYCVENVIFAEGKLYSVATSADGTVVVNGQYALGTKLALTTRNELPVFDQVGEWRIRGDKGE